jgi:hypothetical protein
MNMSNYLANAVVNATVRNNSYTTPPTAYLALFLSNPTKDGTGLECSGASYSREPITMNAPVDGLSRNTNDIEFSPATSSWGEITHVGIYDALSGGNLLYFTELVTTKNIEAGDIFKIALDNLSLQLQ